MLAFWRGNRDGSAEIAGRGSFTARISDGLRRLPIVDVAGAAR
jgi:hypothetical protein